MKQHLGVHGFVVSARHFQQDNAPMNYLVSRLCSAMLGFRLVLHPSCNRFLFHNTAYPSRCLCYSITYCSTNFAIHKET